MFENIVNFFKKLGKNEKEDSRTTAKERLHLVLAQDRANISADFLEMMKQEIIEVIKKYVDIDESSIDVRMTNKPGEDGTVGAPALYANIPIIAIKNEKKKEIKQKIQEDNLAKELEKSENITLDIKDKDIEEKNSKIHENKNTVSDKNVDKKEEITENNTNKKVVENKSQNASEKKETIKKKNASDLKKTTSKTSTTKTTKK